MTFCDRPYQGLIETPQSLRTATIRSTATAREAPRHAMIWLQSSAYCMQGSRTKSPPDGCAKRKALVHHRTANWNLHVEALKLMITADGRICDPKGDGNGVGPDLAPITCPSRELRMVRFIVSRKSCEPSVSKPIIESQVLSLSRRLFLLFPVRKTSWSLIESQQSNFHRVTMHRRYVQSLSAGT